MEIILSGGDFTFRWRFYFQMEILLSGDQLLTATKLLGILRELWASSAFSRGLGSVVAVNLCLECITLLLFWAIWEVLKDVVVHRFKKEGGPVDADGGVTCVWRGWSGPTCQWPPTYPT